MQRPGLGGWRAATMAVALLAGACQEASVGGPMVVPPNAVIDGWEIGEPVDCRDPGPWLADDVCRTDLPAATVGLARRDPGHAPILSSALYRHPEPRGPNGEQLIWSCSGGCMTIAVFQLVDGSLRAVGVGSPGVSPDTITIDYGPRSPLSQD